MLINYWDCKYCNNEEFWDDTDGEEYNSFGCNNPKKENHYCDIDNKYDGKKAECPIAEEVKQNHPQLKRRTY